MVNTIDSITLKPGETKPVILSFIYDGKKSLEDDSAPKDVITVSGDLSLTPIPQADDESRDSKYSRTPEKRSRRGGDFSRSAGDLGNLEPLRLPVSVRLCRAKLDLSLDHISFPLCTLNRSYVKELSIHNPTPVDTRVVITTDSTTTKRQYLQAREGKTGRLIRGSLLLQAESRTTVLVVFMSLTLGTFDGVVRILTPEIDTKGQHDIYVSARTLPLSETLEPMIKLTQVTESISGTGGRLGVSVGSTLDFGDCYAGGTVRRVVTVVNNNDFKIRLSIAALMDAGADEVGFAVRELPEEEESELLKLGIPRAPTEEASENRVEAVEDIPLQPHQKISLSIFFNPLPEIDALSLPTDLSHPPPPITHHTCFLAFRPEKGTGGGEGGSVVVRAHARVRMSRMGLSQREVRFGDVNIGTLRRSVFNVVNLCDIPARFGLEYVSKCVTCLVQPLAYSDHKRSIRGKRSRKGMPRSMHSGHREGHVIPPRGFRRVTVVFVPRKVNPDYHKEVTIRNLSIRAHRIPLNLQEPDKLRDFEQTLRLTVRASIIPSRSALLPSFYFRVVPPPTTTLPNCINFEALIAACPSVRVFTIQNTRTSPLGLVVTSTTEAISVYVASTGDAKSLEGDIVNDPIDKPWPCDGSSVGDVKGEMNTVRLESRRLRRLKEAFSRRELVPVRRVNLMAEGRIRLFAIYRLKSTKSWIGPRFRNAKGSIRITMEKYDRSILPQLEGLSSFRGHPTLREQSGTDMESPTAEADNEQKSKSVVIDEKKERPSPSSSHPSPEKEAIAGGFEPPLTPRRMSSPSLSFTLTPEHPKRGTHHPGKHKRSRSRGERGSKETPVLVIPFQAKVCRSMAVLAQTKINFGDIQGISNSDGKRRSHTIRLQNPSDAPLLFRIEKSGSISSADLHFPENLRVGGVVQPLGVKEIPFEFAPSFPGKFMERVNFLNVLDPTGSAMLTVKANVREQVSFWLQGLSLDYGLCLKTGYSGNQRILVKNVTNRERVYVISHRIRKSPGETRMYHTPAGSPVPPDKKGGAPGEGRGHEMAVLMRLGERHLTATAHETELREEEREKLQLKLRVAIRKRKTEKIKKIKKRLRELASLDAKDNEILNPENTGENKKIALLKAPPTASGPEAVNKLSFSLPANAIQVVETRLRFGPQGHGRIRGTIVVHEDKNRDVVKEVLFKANIRRADFSAPSRKSTSGSSFSVLTPPLSPTKGPTSGRNSGNFSENDQAGLIPPAASSPHSSPGEKWFSNRVDLSPPTPTDECSDADFFQLRSIVQPQGTKQRVLEVTIPARFQPPGSYTSMSVSPSPVPSPATSPPPTHSPLRQSSNRTPWKEIWMREEKESTDSSKLEARAVIFLHSRTMSSSNEISIVWHPNTSQSHGISGNDREEVFWESRGIKKGSPRISESDSPGTRRVLPEMRFHVEGSTVWRSGKATTTLNPLSVVSIACHCVWVKPSKPTSNPDPNSPTKLNPSPETLRNSRSAAKLNELRNSGIRNQPRPGSIGRVTILVNDVFFRCYTVKIQRSSASEEAKAIPISANVDICRTVCQPTRIDLGRVLASHDGWAIFNVRLRLGHSKYCMAPPAVPTVISSGVYKTEVSLHQQKASDSNPWGLRTLTVKIRRPPGAPEALRVVIGVRCTTAPDSTASLARLEISARLERPEYLRFPGLRDPGIVDIGCLCYRGDGPESRQSLSLSSESQSVLANKLANDSHDSPSIPDQMGVPITVCARREDGKLTTVRVSTTLPNQVTLFSDQKLTKPLPYLLQLSASPSSPFRLYAKLRPRLTASALVSGQSRAFTAGIRFEVLGDDIDVKYMDPAVLASRVLLLKGKVVASILTVNLVAPPSSQGAKGGGTAYADVYGGKAGPTPIPVGVFLGQAPRLGTEISVPLLLANRSQDLALRYRLKTSSQTLRAPSFGILTAAGTSGEQRKINAAFIVHRKGLIQETMEVINETLPGGHPLRITLSAFGDPGLLKIVNISTPPTSSFSSHTPPLGGGAVCDLGGMYVARLSRISSPHFTTSITTTNGITNARLPALRPLELSPRKFRLRSESEIRSRIQNRTKRNEGGFVQALRAMVDDAWAVRNSMSELTLPPPHTPTTVRAKNLQGNPEGANLSQPSNQTNAQGGPDHGVATRGSSISGLRVRLHSSSSGGNTGIGSAPETPGDLEENAGELLIVSAARATTGNLRVENVCHSRLALRPLCRHPHLSVTWEQEGSYNSGFTDTPTPAGLHVCGPWIVLNPGDVVEAVVTLRFTHTFLPGSPEFQTLLKGELAPFRTLVVLEDVSDQCRVSASPYSKPPPAPVGTVSAGGVIDVTGMICISTSRPRRTKFDLGRIGYCDGWKDITVSIVLENLSALPLHFRIKGNLPSPFSLAPTGDKTAQSVEMVGEEDYGRDEIKAILRNSREMEFTVNLVVHSRKVPVGPFSYQIELENVNNPILDTHIITIKGHQTTYALAFTRLQTSFGPVPQAPSAHPLPLPSSAPLLPQPHPSAGLPPTPIPHGADRDRFTRALGSLRQYSRSGGSYRKPHRHRSVSEDRPVTPGTVAMMNRSISDDGWRIDVKNQRPNSPLLLDRLPLAERQLVLPALELAGSSATRSHCEEWFGVRNTSDQPIEIKVDSRLDSCFAPYLEMIVTLRSEHAPLSTLSLPANSHSEVRVRISTLPMTSWRELTRAAKRRRRARESIPISSIRLQRAISHTTGIHGPHRTRKSQGTHGSNGSGNDGTYVIQRLMTRSVSSPNFSTHAETVGSQEEYRRDDPRGSQEQYRGDDPRAPNETERESVSRGEGGSIDREKTTSNTGDPYVGLYGRSSPTPPGNTSASSGQSMGSVDTGEAGSNKRVSMVVGQVLLVSPGTGTEVILVRCPIERTSMHGDMSPLHLGSPFLPDSSLKSYHRRKSSIEIPPPNPSPSHSMLTPPNPDPNSNPNPPPTTTSAHIDAKLSIPPSELLMPDAVVSRSALRAAIDMLGGSEGKVGVREAMERIRRVLMENASVEDSREQDLGEGVEFELSPTSSGV